MDPVSEAPASFVLIVANGALLSKDEPTTGSDPKWTPSAGQGRSVF